MLLMHMQRQMHMMRLQRHQPLQRLRMMIMQPLLQLHPRRRQYLPTIITPLNPKLQQPVLLKAHQWRLLQWPILMWPMLHQSNLR